ncbi:unnamed protein product [Prorocentrum cordatum]|nr:unnamed protein product [Polarella glacialis]
MLGHVAKLTQSVRRNKRAKTGHGAGRRSGTGREAGVSGRTRRGGVGGRAAERRSGGQRGLGT